MNNCYKGDKCLCVEGVLVKNGFRCAFCLVYGAHTREDKLAVWEELSFLSGLYQVTFCYMGDFNEITQVEERKGASTLPVSAVEFKAWMQEMELVDLALSDRMFTWFRGQSCNRIDRVLVSLEWIEEFPDIRLKGGPRGLSDHCPLIVDVTRVRVGPRPFWSLDSWFTHDGFLRTVREEWRRIGDVQFIDKLKALTVPLGRWHRDNFGNMDGRITRFEKEIKKVDDLVSNGVYDGTMEARRKALLSEAEATELDLLSSVEEIKDAVWDCGSTKAPDSNGYNMNFIKKCWEEDAEGYAWFSRGDSECLCEGQKNSRWGPDCLRNCALAKVKKKSSAIIKLDFQKAYDRVKWSFVDIVLHKMGFGLKWREWIKECVCSASMSVLINGSPSKPLKMERGLRQGDPLSPFLFVLVVDVLHRIIGEAVRNGCIAPLLVGRDDIELSHLQFADDTILFCPPEETTIRNYK
ncbi:uncharacterized protein [Arachis hypogaea]|uniref:uncharacterized protein n=1 Tax=Arachis hypogaea TaxID=3818 RepID=UPI003B21DEB9